MSETQATVEAPVQEKATQPGDAPLTWARRAVPNGTPEIAEEMEPYVDAGTVFSLYTKLRDGWLPNQLRQMYSTDRTSGLFENSLKVALFDLYKQRLDNPEQGVVPTPESKLLPRELDHALRDENASLYGAGPDFGKIEFRQAEAGQSPSLNEIFVDHPDSKELLARAAQREQVQGHMQQFEREALQELQETEADALEDIEADARKQQEGAERAQAEATAKFFGTSNEPYVIAPDVEAPIETMEGPVQVRPQYEFEVRFLDSHIELACGDDKVHFCNSDKLVIECMLAGLKQIGAIKMYREV